MIAVSGGSGGFSGIVSVFWPGNFGKVGSTGFAALAAAVFATSLAEGGLGNAATGALVLGATANFGKLAISVFGNTIGFASAFGGSTAGLAGGVTGAGNSAGGRVSFTAAGFASFFTTGAATGSGSFVGGATTSGAGNVGSDGGFGGSDTGGVPSEGSGGNVGSAFSAAGISFGASFFAVGGTTGGAAGTIGGAGGTKGGTGGGAGSAGALEIFFSSLRVPCFSGSFANVFSIRLVTEGGNAGGGGGAVSGTGTKIGEAEIGGADAGCDNAFSNADLLCFGSPFFAGAGLLTTTGFVSFAAGFSFTGLMFDGTASASGEGSAGIAGAVAFGVFTGGNTAAGSGGKSPGRGCSCCAVLGLASAFTAGNCVAGTTVGKGAFCQFVGFAGFAGEGVGAGGTTGTGGVGATAGGTGANVGNGAGIGAATGSFSAGAGAVTGAGGGGTTGAGAGIGAATGAFTTGTGAGAGGATGLGAGIGAGATTGAGVGAIGCGAGTASGGFTRDPRLPRVLVFDVCCASGSAAGIDAAGSGRTKGCAGTSGRFSTGTARSTTGGATGAGAGATGAPPCRPRNASRLTSTLGGVADACASAGAALSPHAMLHALASSAARKAVTG